MKKGRTEKKNNRKRNTQVSYIGFIFFATAHRGRGGRRISKFTQSNESAQIHTEREKEEDRELYKVMILQKVIKETKKERTKRKQKPFLDKTHKQE